MFKKKFIPAYLLTFVNALGFSILIPVLPFIVKNYGAPEYVYGLILSLYAVFQFIGAPYLGSLSDRIGRKPVLLFSQIGTLLSWLIFAIAYFLPEEPVFLYALPIWVIMFARITDGITAGNVSATNAYISDVTTPDEKRVIFGYVGGLVGIGIIVGPGIGGVAASSSLGYLGAILIAIFISIITAFSIAFFMKESLKEENKQKKEPFDFWKTVLITRRITLLNASKEINQVFLLRFIMSSVMSCYIGTIALLMIDLYKFNEQELGFFMLFVGLCLSINQAFVYKWFATTFGEVKTMIIGFCFVSVGFYVVTLQLDLYMYMILYYVLNLGFSLVFPTFNTLISQKGDPKKQGEAMGISESINSFSNAIYPALAALAYSYYGYKLYYLLAFVPIIGIYFAIQLYKSVNGESKQEVLGRKVSK